MKYLLLGSRRQREQEEWDERGSGDAARSLFWSPVAPVGGWILGIGPVFIPPTATDDLLTAKRWGTGPTAAVLKQQHALTYGALVNHVWSVAGRRTAGTSTRPSFSRSLRLRRRPHRRSRSRRRARTRGRQRSGACRGQVRLLRRTLSGPHPGDRGEGSAVPGDRVGEPLVR